MSEELPVNDPTLPTYNSLVVDLAHERLKNEEQRGLIVYLQAQLRQCRGAGDELKVAELKMGQQKACGSMHGGGYTGYMSNCGACRKASGLPSIEEMDRQAAPRESYPYHSEPCCQGEVVPGLNRFVHEEGCDYAEASKDAAGAPCTWCGKVHKVIA